MTDHNLVNFSIVVSDGSIIDCDYYFDFYHADYADMSRHLAKIQCSTINLVLFLIFKAILHNALVP